MENSVVQSENAPVVASAPVAQVAVPKSVIVASIGEAIDKETGEVIGVYLTCRNRFLSGLRSQAEMTGTYFAEKGMTKEELETAFPRGTDISKILAWGSQVEIKQDDGSVRLLDKCFTLAPKY